ncbi:MAG: hypothetical protein APR53_06040 [Methanoculleus sp. SDB]|nr:MAG: hypothetical protein APR53_06040 [Methanoculleus sp. SDB]
MLKRPDILLLLLLVLAFMTASPMVSAHSFDQAAMADYYQAQADGEIPRWVDADKEALSKPVQKMSTDLRILVGDNYLPPSMSREEVQDYMRMSHQFSPGGDFVPNLGERAPADVVYVYISLNRNAADGVVDPYVWSTTDRNEAAGLIVAWVEVDRLEDLAALEDVRTIRPVFLPDICTGSVTSEGDGVHRADLARSTFGFDGSGIKVGVISDSADHVADAIMTGDLPADVVVVQNDYPGSHSDEGIAMMEIVYDIAPGAKLYFHDCGGNTEAFNDAISALVAAGCDVIVDDIAWKFEPYFEDGEVARHVQTITDTNDVIYVSSAGNYAGTHYQGEYFKNTDYPDSEWHDFSHGADYRFLYTHLEPGGSVEAVLQWDDLWGGSGNDYNMGLYDATNGGWVAVSNNIQDGTGDPFERVYYMNTGNSGADYYLIVEKYAGQPRELEVYFFCRNQAYLYTNNLVSEDSVFGHRTVPGALAVGAVHPANPEQIASYSSQGPSTIAYPQPEIRNKPDITGVAGVQVTGTGGFPVPFYGTSASAPHVAAIAALTWSAAPEKTGDEISQVLLDTAQDLGTPGFDYIYGYGLADAFEALSEIQSNSVIPLPGCTNPPLDPDQDGLFEDVNGDGVFSFGDIRLFFEYYDVWIPANEPIECFDFDGNSAIGFGDVRAHFWEWGT